MVEAADLLVWVTSVDDGDQDEAAGLARRLRAELLDLDVDAVGPWSGDMIQEGAKGGSGLGVMLVVRWGAAGLQAVLTKIRDWVLRNGCSVEATIDGDTVKVTGATWEQQEKIINAWLARHAGNP